MFVSTCPNSVVCWLEVAALKVAKCKIFLKSEVKKKVVDQRAVRL